MTVSFDEFKLTLSEEQRAVLEKILEDDVRKKSGVLLEHIERDKKHLEIVNFCANFYIPGQALPEKTGYQLALIEPLYSLEIKNFDLGIFRKGGSSLILVECKSSISDAEKNVDDLMKAIKVANERKDELEKILGNKITDPIEFALCLPAFHAQEIYTEISEADAPICLWAADLWEKKIRLFAPQEEDTRALILAGRLHRDGTLNRLLGQSVDSTLRAIRTIPILPSSHMCTLLLHISELIYLESKVLGKLGEFQYSDVFSILVKELGHFTDLSEEDLEKLAIRILETGIRKGIIKELTDDVIELPRRAFQLSGRKTNAEMVRKNVEGTYVDHNAREKAKLESVDRYKRETGTTTLNSFGQHT